MNAALELRDVHASYGPFRALFGVSFSVPTAGVVALLGANGSGKTTCARAASGLVRATSGSVFVNGRDCTGLRTFEFARQGVVHVPEGRSVFASLSVAENLELALRQRHKGSLQQRVEAAYELFPKLGERRGQLAGTLSGGEQRMLALARAVADTPTVLIADELSLGLAPIIVDEVYATLQTIRRTGTAILVVEQHVGHALGIADDVVVLERGAVVYDGPVGDLPDLSALTLHTDAGTTG